MDVTPSYWGRDMRIVMFYHSIISDWNHGNAHFLRGVVTELLGRGHDVRVYEPKNGWSYTNYLKEKGDLGVRQFRNVYPRLIGIQYDIETLDLDEVLGGANLVIVHEWNDPRLVEKVGRYRLQHPSLRLLFHDTHHRCVTDPAGMKRYDLSHFDGVLAFGKVIRDIYLKNGWAKRAWTWHEAADTRVFKQHPEVKKEGDLVWVGNWGDDERTEELMSYLIRPVKELGLRATVYGVRYPSSAVKLLEETGIQYGGWLPNFEVPRVFSKFRVTVHIPRRPYAESLPGIPTIRPFEALACGIPLLCSPWRDTEHLFSPGKDFKVARDGKEMTELLDLVLREEKVSSKMTARGLKTIVSKHTCAHRVNELFAICQELGIDPYPRKTWPMLRGVT